MSGIIFFRIRLSLLLESPILPNLLMSFGRNIPYRLFMYPLPIND